MLLGRAKDHNTDVHRFLNLTTRRVIKSRDVLWLNKTYGVWKGIGRSTTPMEAEWDADAEILDPQQWIDRPPPGREDQTEFLPIEPMDVQEAEDPRQTLLTPTNHKLATAMRQLGGWFNPAANAYNAKVRFAKDVRPPAEARTPDPEDFHPAGTRLCTIRWSQ